MKLRASLLCLVLLALAVAPAAAQFPIDIPGQLYLGWSECAGGGGLDYQFFACGSTAGAEQLYASALVPAAIPDIIADAGIMDVIAGLNPLVMPTWWEFNVGGCNANNLVYSADFSLAPGGCFDLWAGLGSTGGQYGGENSPLPLGNRARVKWSTAVLPALSRVMPGGVETYIEGMSFKRIRNLTCPGCIEPACMVYQEEKLSLLSGQTLRITNPGFAAANAFPAQFNCPGSTPTKHRSWGDIKALYR